MNGAVPNEGRLEMYVDDQWGTFCDDYWTDREADVACRQLGYEQGAVRNGGRFLQSHFGAADEGVPIWLDNLLCDGDESNLMDCPRASQREGTDLGQHNCSLEHLEDVGVRCLTAEPARFSVADASVNEGGMLFFQITLSRARESATRVDYATSDGTARAGADYVPASGTLVFYAGELTRTVTATVLDDAPRRRWRDADAFQPHRGTHRGWRGGWHDRQQRSFAKSMDGELWAHGRQSSGGRAGGAPRYVAEFLRAAWRPPTGRRC